MPDAIPQEPRQFIVKDQVGFLRQPEVFDLFDPRIRASLLLAARLTVDITYKE